MADLSISRGGRLNASMLLDVLERITLMALFVRMVVINADVIGKPGHWFNGMLLVSEGLAVLLVMIRRRSSDVSLDARDWLFAFLATIGPLLVAPLGGRPLIPAALGVGLISAGLLTQLSAKVVLGRSFGIVPANRGIKVEGPYRLVRHPMYLGYISVQVTFLLLAPNAWNLAVYAVSWTIQIMRILAEERLLSQDPAYADFMRKTRFRLLPGVF